MRPSPVVHAHEHGHPHERATAAPAGKHAHGVEERGPAAHGAARIPARAPFVTLGRSRRGRGAAGLGEKAAALDWLARQGVAVPAAVALPADVAERVARGDTLAQELVAGALRRWLDPDRRYAVRRSPVGGLVGAGSADGPSHARLDVPAADVPAAVRAVAGLSGSEASLAGAPATNTGVIVQEMVAAVAAGVAFSRNPLSGLDEVVVEAIPGRGDALAEDGARPQRWVRRWGAFIERPEQPRVEAAITEAAARETASLAKAFGRPVRLEWVHDGSALWWLGAKPMTNLEGLRVYSNRISREVLPGIVKPLVWSVNVPIVNAAWIDLLEELVGRLDVRPEDLARSFGYHAYFDMTTLGTVFAALGMPRDALELLLGLPKGPEAPRFTPTAATYRHLPRMGAVALRTLRRGRWARREVAELQATIAVLAAVDPEALDEAALLARVDALTDLTRRAAYANIVVPLLMLGYGRALERQLSAAGLDPRSVDPAAERADLRAWDPNAALASLRATADALPAAARDDLAARGAEALAQRDDLAPLRAEVAAFLERFGHLSASGSDFTVPPWREDPERVAAMLHDRPARPADELRTTLVDAETRTPRYRRPVIRLLWRRAGAFRVYREAVSSTYTRGYGLFRGTFLALGSRFVARGLLDVADDVFFLTLAEVRALAAGSRLPEDGAHGDPRVQVARRRRDVEDAAELVVPDTVYGDAFVPLRREEVVRERLHGIPTSRGSARGPARVVRGAADFGRVHPGDVLVIPFSDVGWAPLFAGAAAVVAEAGGILSHSSIVAREYDIPCVVSVSDACAVIPDGAIVVVDGVAGTVVVEDPAG